MEKQITVRICDLCTSDQGHWQPAKARYQCPICGRDLCSTHTEHIEFVDVICTDCKKAVDSLRVEEKDHLKRAIVELLKPIVIIKKL
jgi:ribosomal protein S27E